MAEYRHFDVEEVHNATVLRLRESELLEHATAIELRDDLRAFLKESRPKRMIVSFESVERFSSQTISSLLDCRERCVFSGTMLMLCDMSPNVRNAFQLLNMDGPVFRIYSTLTEAINS